VRGNQHIGGLDIAVDNSLLVGMLHGLANLQKQLQPFPNRHLVLIAILGDRHALDQLHDKIRPSTIRLPAIIHLGDIGMIHQSQRLPLRFETCHHLPRIHARFDDLECDLPPKRLLLLSDKHQPHAAFADLFHELVGADDGAGAFRNRVVDRFSQSRCG